MLRQPTPTRSAPGEQTRDRLIEAAEELFSAKGFTHASVRDITQAAQANVAAVNYHFGGKERLYEEVFRRTIEHMRERRLAAMAKVLDRPSPTLTGLLRAFAESFLEPLADESRGRRMMQLFFHEMADPHLPEGFFFDRMAGPILNAMQRAFDRTCPGLDREDVVMCMNSIVGQLIHLCQLQSIFRGLESDDWPGLDFGKAVDHVVLFSEAGVRALAKQGDRE